MLSEYEIPLLLSLVVSIFIIGKSEKISLDFSKKKISSIFMILILASSFIPNFGVQNAYADNEIRQIIKIRETYSAGVAFEDFIFQPPLQDFTKAFAFIDFKHVAEEDHSDTFRNWEILNNTHIRIFGENTAGGNNALDFTAYIIEYTGEINVQHIGLTRTASEAEGEKTVTISAINTTNSFIINTGHRHNASETTIGDEELDRVRIVDSTTAGFFVANTPNTGPQRNTASVVDWNDDRISVQRGLHTLADQDNTDTISPSTSVDPTRTMLLVTYTNNFGTSIDNDDMMLEAELNSSGDIVITRFDNEGTMTIAWELIEFPANFARVHHLESTLSGGSLTATVTVPEVQDYDKSFVISTVGTPFGWGTGQINEAGTPGAIDRAMANFWLAENDEVFIEREDSTGTATFGYQVVELLETPIAERPQATNTIRQVIPIEGTINAGVKILNVTISPPLADTSRAIAFITFRHDSSLSGVEDTSQLLKSWDIADKNTFQIFGSQNKASPTQASTFFGYIIEFDSSSNFFNQGDQIIYSGYQAGDDSPFNNTKIMTMSPVNVSNAFIHSKGQGNTIEDPTFGREEFARYSIINETRWGYDVNIPQNYAQTIHRVGIIDLNDDRVRVQRGTVDVTGTSVSVSPPLDIIKNQTLLFVSHQITSETFGEDASDTALLAYLDSSSPPDIVLEREVDNGFKLIANWILVEVPEDFASIQHGTHFQDIGIMNSTETISSVGNFSRSMVTGTVSGPYGYGNGKGNFTEVGAFKTTTATMELEDDTTIRFQRNNASGNFEVGWQVFEFTPSLSSVQTFNLSEAIILVDDYNNNLTSIQTLNDTISIVDLFNTALTANTGLSPETISIVDTFGSNLTMIQNFTDTISILDVFSSELEGQLTLPEILNITDNFIAELTVLQNFTDSLILIDNFSLEQEFIQDLSDTITILDVFNAEIEGAINISEAITILDVFNTTLFYSQTLPETILITDIFTATLTADFSAIDTVEIIDAFLATCATCSTTPVIPPTTGGGGGGGGVPTSPSPFGRSALVNLQLKDITISAKPGTIIDLKAMYTWNAESQIQIVNFEPQRQRWFSTVLPVIENPTIEDPNNGEIPFSFRLPSITCQTQGDFDAQTCYESNFIQFPITVSGVSDGRLSSDTAIVTIVVESGIKIPLIWYIVSGLMLFSLIISWWVAFGRRKHKKDGDRVLKRKHTAEEHRKREIRNELRRNKRNRSRKEGTLKDRLNSRSDSRRTQRQKIVRKKKTVG